jgi:hypothetical protein
MNVYLGVGLNLSARRLPPPLLGTIFVALSSDFGCGCIIAYTEAAHGRNVVWQVEYVIRGLLPDIWPSFKRFEDSL